MAARTPRRALVIGCGGTLGFAWTMAALEALEVALDFDAREADVLVGTSAGAEVVAMLGAGNSVVSILDALAGQGADAVLTDHLSKHPGNLPPLPKPSLPGLGMAISALRQGSLFNAAAGLLPRGRGDNTWLLDLGEALQGPLGWVAHPATWIVAADVKTGQRVAFGRADAPEAELGEAIAASWGIPGWFPPVEISGRSYLDGGAVSPTSADLLIEEDLDEVIVVAPMTSAGGARGKGFSRIERLLRAQMTHTLDAEIRLLTDAGHHVVRIEPGPEVLAAMGPNFMDLGRRDQTLATARATSPTRVRDAVARARQEIS